MKDTFALVPETPVDSATGFFDCRGNSHWRRVARQAHEYVQQTGAECHCVLMDVRNMGGINGVLGRAKADEVLAAFTAIVRRELSAVAVDAVFFRIGGDESIAILFGTSEQAVSLAVSKVHASIQTLAEALGIAAIPHSKYSGEARFRGVGVDIVDAPITKMKDHDQAVKLAYFRLHASKVKLTPALVAAHPDQLRTLWMTLVGHDADDIATSLKCNPPQSARDELELLEIVWRRSMKQRSDDAADCAGADDVNRRDHSG